MWKKEVSEASSLHQQSKVERYKMLTSKASRHASDSLFTASADELANSFISDETQSPITHHSK